MAVRFWQVGIMRQRTKASYAIRIERVLTEIVARMDEPLRLEDLASVAGVSRFHFHRVFQAMVGETIGEVVRRMRLTRAEWRLRTSGESVTEIALEAGYGSVEGFGRAFRSAYSMAPSSYRVALPPTPLRPSNIRIDYRQDCNHVRFIHATGDHGMDVTIETFPCEPAVLLRHVEPYENVGEELTDRPCVEWYLNDPMDTPEPELLTKLCIPLQSGLA